MSHSAVLTKGNYPLNNVTVVTYCRSKLACLPPSETQSI